MCIHAFRQTIEYYKLNPSPVLICYMDATKAFDRVNHWLLFKKLLDREVLTARLSQHRYPSSRHSMQILDYNIRPSNYNNSLTHNYLKH